MADTEDIVSVIGRFFTIKRRGRLYTTVEHDSLIIWPDTNSWYWYSRGIGGGVRAWYRLWGLTPPSTVSPLQKRRKRNSIVALDNSLHLYFEKQMTSADRNWWYSRGLDEQTIANFHNGVCHHELYGRCYTIPLLNDGKLRNIKLRLTDKAERFGRYRFFYRNQPLCDVLFNKDALTAKEKIYLVAGEIKAEVMTRFDLTALSGVNGCQHWHPSWDELLRGRNICLVFDPGEEEHAFRIGRRLCKNSRVRILQLPHKPDDFILKYGRAAFLEYEKLYSTEVTK